MMYDDSVRGSFRVLTPGDMRRTEQKAFDLGVPSLLLMEDLMDAILRFNNTDPDYRVELKTVCYETESERDEALDAITDESRRLVKVVLDKALFGVLDTNEKESGHA